MCATDGWVALVDDLVNPHRKDEVHKTHNKDRSNPTKCGSKA